MAYTKAAYDQAVKTIRQQVTQQPTLGLVLGSGLGTLTDMLTDSIVIDYEDIPNWPHSTVPGHEGRLHIGQLHGRWVVAQQGRAHFYEGYTLQQITFPVRVMRLLGIDTLIVTNAAGGINPAFNAGEIMLIADHINFLGLTGLSPLTGRNDDAIGPRFPSLVHTYDRELRARARQVADELGITLREGVYAGVSGPAYETPAEVRMLRAVGADAVGMSTVNEVLVARHAGMRVVAFSSITNVAIDTLDTDRETSHDEVLEMSARIRSDMTQLVDGVIESL